MKLVASLFLFLPSIALGSGIYNPGSGSAGGSFIEARDTLQTGTTAYPEYIYASSITADTVSVGSVDNTGKFTIYLPSVFTRFQFLAQGGQPTFRFNDISVNSLREIGQIDSTELRIMNNGTVMAHFVNGGTSLGPFDVNYNGSPLLSVQGTVRTPVFNTTTTSATVTGSAGLVVGNLTAGRCVQTDTGGLLTAAAGACGTSSSSLSIATPTGTYAISSTATVILADATGASFTATLPTAVGISGTVYRVKRLNSGPNTVTIGTTSAQTIDGATTQVLTVQYSSVDLISDGANWGIL